MRFRGRVAIVTGGASGMGAATVRALVEEGAAVAILDANEELARAVGRETGAAVIVGDVSDPAVGERAVRETLDECGRLDVLVNAAGIVVRADGPGTTDGDWRRIMGVNVDGVFFTSRAALVPMREQRSGAIVNFGSIWGGVGAAGVLAYCATKGAVHQLTRAMALDHVHEGIRVNAVCPGEVDTPMIRSARSGPVTEETMAALAASVPLGRLARPEEVARVVLFLASDEASYMTGALVPVDAGYTAR